MSRQHSPDASAVHATAALWSIPAPLRMLGLTNRMYAIVRNVAIAPRSSRPTREPRADNVNVRFRMDSLIRASYRVSDANDTAETD